MRPTCLIVAALAVGLSTAASAQQPSTPRPAATPAPAGHWWQARVSITAIITVPETEGPSQPAQ